MFVKEIMTFLTTQLRVKHNLITRGAVSLRPMRFSVRTLFTVTDCQSGFLMHEFANNARTWTVKGIANLWEVKVCVSARVTFMYIHTLPSFLFMSRLRCFLFDTRLGGFDFTIFMFSAASAGVT